MKLRIKKISRQRSLLIFDNSFLLIIFISGPMYSVPDHVAFPGYSTTVPPPYNIPLVLQGSPTVGVAPPPLQFSSLGCSGKIYK